MIGLFSVLALFFVCLLVMFWRRRGWSEPALFKYPVKDMWEFDRNVLHVGQEIGHGAFGVIHKGTALNIRGMPGQTEVAVKFCNAEAVDSDKIDFVREAEQMKLFKHKNVIRMLGVCMQDQPLCIIVELMDFGDMKEYLRANHNTPVDVQLKMAFDVTAGLAYLARIHVVYGARFPTESYTRGCHWIPRMFA
jgi:serine/threonine protein kinase